MCVVCVCVNQRSCKPYYTEHSSSLLYGKADKNFPNPMDTHVRLAIVHISFAPIDTKIYFVNVHTVHMYYWTDTCI